MSEYDDIAVLRAAMSALARRAVKREVLRQMYKATSSKPLPGTESGYEPKPLNSSASVKRSEEDLIAKAVYRGLVQFLAESPAIEGELILPIYGISILLRQGSDHPEVDITITYGSPTNKKRFEFTLIGEKAGVSKD